MHSSNSDAERITIFVNAQLRPLIATALRKEQVSICFALLFRMHMQC